MLTLSSKIGFVRKRIGTHACVGGEKAMPGHDIIVIGTSAGGLEPLTTLAAGLPADLPAALFIVQHIPATGVSLLPQILDHVGALPAMHAVEGARSTSGLILRGG